MVTRRLSFKNRRGESLSARLELPLGESVRAYAIFAHCFTCSKDSRAAVEVSRALGAEGIAVLRFDFAGLGQSGGEFSDTNFSTNVQDLVAAAEFLESEFAAPKILVGHSLGGAAVLEAAGQLPDVTAIATIGAPANPSHVSKLLGCSVSDIASTGQANVELAGRTFTFKEHFLDSLEREKLTDVLKKFHAAILVLHAPLDQYVGIENAGEIFRAAKHPKSFISLDDADHLLLDADDARYVGQVISSWAVRYLPKTDNAIQPLVDRNNLLVKTEAGGFLSEISVGNHQFLADEPARVGGTNLGPTPYDFLSAALGSCTTMTLRMYADRKGWPLERATVSIDHNKVHITDCEGCDDTPKKVDQFTRTVSLEGALTKEQRLRLLEIANRCPVHHTLTSDVKIETKLST